MRSALADLGPQNPYWNNLLPNTYRIGVIGHTGRGNYGHGLDSVWLQLPNCKIVAVADANEKGLAAAAKKLKAPQAVGAILIRMTTGKTLVEWIKDGNSLNAVPDTTGRSSEGSDSTLSRTLFVALRMLATDSMSNASV